MSRLDEDDLAQNEDGPGEPAVDWREKLPFEFNRRNVIVAVAGLVAFCVAWFFTGLLVWIVLGAAAGGFVGLLVGMLIGLETQMDDYRIDFGKCLVAAGFLVVPAWLMIKWGLMGPGPAMFALLAPVLVTYMVIQLLWRDFVVSEVVVVEAGMLLGIAFVGGIVAAAIAG